jgi:anti-sigma regulatory factor (Ser/Thr protein kinase)
MIDHQTINSKIWLVPLDQYGKLGIELCACDHGPGMENLELAVTDKYSSIDSLGHGLGLIPLCQVKWWH